MLKNYYGMAWNGIFNEAFHEIRQPWQQRFDVSAFADGVYNETELFFFNIVDDMLAFDVG